MPAHKHKSIIKPLTPQELFKLRDAWKAVTENVPPPPSTEAPNCSPPVDPEEK